MGDLRDVNIRASAHGGVMVDARRGMFKRAVHTCELVARRTHAQRRSSPFIRITPPARMMDLARYRSTRVCESLGVSHVAGMCRSVCAHPSSAPRWAL